LDNVDSTSPAIRSLGEGWFTGKPYVEGLGHAFLMRNYRAGLAKWQTVDPLGYPDGWNQLAYCGNGVIGAVDLWGCKTKVVNLVWNDHYEWVTHLVPGTGGANKQYYKSYDRLYDELKVTIEWDSIIDNMGLVNIVVKSINCEYTGNAHIVANVTIPLPWGVEVTVGHGYVVGWDVPSITRSNGVDVDGRRWNDEEMILHLKVYSTNLVGISPPVLEDYGKAFELSGDVLVKKDVKLYDKAYME
jgi:RHS repeat-associated protein